MELHTKDDENQKHVRAIQQAEYDNKILRDESQRKDAESTDFLDDWGFWYTNLVSFLKQQNQNHSQIMAETMRKQMQEMFMNMNMNGQIPVHSMNSGPIPDKGFPSHSPAPQPMYNRYNDGLNRSQQSDIDYFTNTQDLSRSDRSISSSSSSSTVITIIDRS